MRPDTVQIFKALSDSNRLLIVGILQQRDLCVCEIRSVLELSNSIVSEHLSGLKRNRTGPCRKDSKWVNYRLNDNQGKSAVTTVLKMVEESFPKETALKRNRVKEKSVDREKICHLNK